LAQANQNYVFSNVCVNLRLPRQISEGKLNKTACAARICNYELNLTFRSDYWKDNNYRTLFHSLSAKYKTLL